MRARLEQKLAAHNNIVRAVIHKDIPVSKLGEWEKHYIEKYRTHTSQGGCNETWGG